MASSSFSSPAAAYDALAQHDEQPAELAKAQTHAHYRADIDGLRAVAVAAVIVYDMNHAWLPAGFVGVDCFFVISGFVLTSSLLRHPSTSIFSWLTAFYARRIKRLVPAMICMSPSSCSSHSFSALPALVLSWHDVSRMR